MMQIHCSTSSENVIVYLNGYVALKNKKENYAMHVGIFRMFMLCFRNDCNGLFAKLISYFQELQSVSD